MAMPNPLSDATEMRHKWLPHSEYDDSQRNEAATGNHAVDIGANLDHRKNGAG